MTRFRRAPHARSVVVTLACAAGTTLVSTLISLWASPKLPAPDVLVIYMLGVLGVSMRFSTEVSICTAIANVLAFDFFFIPPPYVFSLPDIKSALTCGGMVLVALVVSGRTHKLRQAEALARAREARTSILYALSRELSQACDIDQLAAIASAHLERLTGCSTEVVVASRAEQLPSAGADPSTFLVPLSGARGVVGQVALRLKDKTILSEEEEELLQVCARQVALAIERAELATQAAASEIAAETERARSALLSSLSHDLRTPLAAIVGAGTSLAEYGDHLDAAARRDLAESVVEEGERLHRLLANILALTKLEGGRLVLKKTPHSIEEILDCALRRAGARLLHHAVAVHVPFDVPLVPLDPVLIEQLLINVLENAIRYAPNGSPIAIFVTFDDDEVAVRVADSGPGVRSGDEQKIFEKFYRGSSSNPRDGGMGLGLYICQATATAHGGRIWAQNRSGGGLDVVFTLPRDEDGELAMPPDMMKLDESEGGRDER
jgi:two-component system sensor histidine kinase KdpD